jgi:hypothetical protein
LEWQRRRLDASLLSHVVDSWQTEAILPLTEALGASTGFVAHRDNTASSSRLPLALWGNIDEKEG